MGNREAIMSSATQAERVNFRIELEKKELIERAAAVKGLSLTDFAVTTLYREAQEVLKNEQVLTLSDRDRDAFLAALDNPPKPNAAALRAARRYRAARQDGTLR